MLREVKQALIGFAIVNGRLPCPDVDNDADATETPSVVDGQEDCASVAAGFDAGFLPWAALELRPSDAWGHLFYYRVTPEFTYTAVAGATAGANRLDLEDVGDIEIRTRGDDPAAGTGGEGKEPVVLATTAPAIVISFGANGLGARNIDGDTRAGPDAGTDEAENLDGGAADRIYISRFHTPGDPACDEADEDEAFCEYDDLMIWLSRSVLIGEMVNAGVLP